MLTYLLNLLIDLMTFPNVINVNPMNTLRTTAVTPFIVSVVAKIMIANYAKNPKPLPQHVLTANKIIPLTGRAALSIKL